jgi:hypothetical protein
MVSRENGTAFGTYTRNDRHRNEKVCMEKRRNTGRHTPILIVELKKTTPLICGTYTLNATLNVHQCQPPLFHTLSLLPSEPILSQNDPEINPIRPDTFKIGAAPGSWIAWTPRAPQLTLRSVTSR